MPKEKALNAYLKEKLNCAQSVYTGFQDLLQVPHVVIESARKHGGGKAEGGLCGALHAALALSRKPETQRHLRSRFEEVAGSQHCREIRNKKLLRCDECVELAAMVLTEQEHPKK